MAAIRKLKKKTSSKRISSSKKSRARLVEFQPFLIESLEDPEVSANYLTDAIEHGDINLFLLAVRNVIEARGGMGKASKGLPNIHRVSLYKALSKNGNPLFSTMIDILDSLGFGLKPYVKSKRRVA